MNSKFSRLRMKHNARHMFNCTKSTCTYALFEITDYFFTLLWPDVSNYMLNFSLELKKPCVVCWHIPWISRTPTRRNH